MIDAPLAGRIPRYLAIAEALRERLPRRANGSGQRLPSQSALAREFRVSRETLREALALLRHEGLVYSRVGRGTFVSPYRPVGVRITQPINEPYISGRPSVMHVLAQGFVPAPPEARRALGLRPGARVFRYLALRTIRRRAFRLGSVYLPDGVARKIDLRRPPRLTVSQRIEREAGVRLLRAHQLVTATAASAAVARHLGLPVGSPALMFERTYYGEDGRAAEFVLEYQDSRRFPYRETLVRSGR